MWQYERMARWFGQPPSPCVPCVPFPPALRSVFIRFKRDLTDYKEGEFEAEVTYEAGFKLHTTAWAISLAAFLIALLAKKPSAGAELAAEAAGAV